MNTKIIQKAHLPEENVIHLLKDVLNFIGEYSVSGGHQFSQSSR